MALQYAFRQECNPSSTCLLPSCKEFPEVLPEIDRTYSVCIDRSGKNKEKTCKDVFLTSKIAHWRRLKRLTTWGQLNHLTLLKSIKKWYTFHNTWFDFLNHLNSSTLNIFGAKLRQDYIFYCTYYIIIFFINLLHFYLLEVKILFIIVMHKSIEKSNVWTEFKKELIFDNKLPNLFLIFTIRLFFFIC